MTPTPHERRLKRLQLDAQLDCSPQELEGRRRQRAEREKSIEAIKRHWRYMDLSPASKAELERRRQARSDAEYDSKFDERQAHREALRDAAQAEWKAFGGVATQQQIDGWKDKYARLMIPFNERMAPLTVLPFPAAPSKALKLDFFSDNIDRKPKQWLIKKVLARGETSSVFGAPGSLKSALAIDFAVHVGAGKDWRGRKSKSQAGVVIFAFERSGQALRRLTAYAKRDGITKLPIAVASNIIDLLNPDSVQIVVDTVRAAESRFGTTVGMIILDTFAKGIAAGGGDENSARDQNIAAANLRRVHETLQVHILTIGHAGKDESRGERGSNARQGDVDLQIAVTGEGDTKTAKIVKANDVAEDVLTVFKGEVIEMGIDEDGERESEFIVSAQALSAPPQGRQKLSDRQTLALETLRKLLIKQGKTQDGVQIVEVDIWRDALFAAGVLDEDAANPRKDFTRLRDALARKKLVVQHDGWIRLAIFGH